MEFLMQSLFSGISQAVLKSAKYFQKVQGVNCSEIKWHKTIEINVYTKIKPLAHL